ncbi:hypothetical protein E2C01_057742 [Portunus trituberculatus]|uniref:Uncharacterized protein n=1 Tax=Portunus trituberculatus TaxID=210409 RepID=A0A5B7GTT3_PORTR|nr:hypothetical protein [Portunus trituberculatus]
MDIQKFFKKKYHLQTNCDTLKGKHIDAFATELYEKTKALCHIHNIPEPKCQDKEQTDEK